MFHDRAKLWHQYTASKNADGYEMIVINSIFKHFNKLSQWEKKKLNRITSANIH